MAESPAATQSKEFLGAYSKPKLALMTSHPATLDPVLGQRDASGAGATVLRVAEVGKAFHRGVWPVRRSVRVLDGATLEVRPGELVGLVGENGSGKSTLLQIIVGLLDRDAGTVEQPGRLGYCPQQAMLWDKLTVDEHFALFARAYGMDDAARHRAVGEMLEELQFERYRGYRVEALSGGTRQKLNLALALMHEPQLLCPARSRARFSWCSSSASTCSQAPQ